MLHVKGNLRQPSWNTGSAPLKYNLPSVHLWPSVMYVYWGSSSTRGQGWGEWKDNTMARSSKGTDHSASW